MKALIRPPKTHSLQALQSADPDSHRVSAAEAQRLRGGTDGEFPWQISIRP